jgi:hypothetical protein
MRELLESGGLPQPDRVRYEFEPDEVVLFWDEPKTAIVIELDESERPRQTDANGSAEPRAAPDHA